MAAAGSNPSTSADNNIGTDVGANDLMGSVSDIIVKAVNDALTDNPPEASVKPKRSVNSPIAPRSTRKGNRSDTDGAMVGDIVSQVLTAVTPVIANIVKAAVASSTEQILKKMDETSKEMKSETMRTVDQVKKEVQAQKFELDRLEQYGRRDNVKIFGIPFQEDENTNQVIMDLAADIGVDISPSDISVSHRLPSSRNDRPKPILVKFVRRDTKTSFMKKKKELRQNENRKDVYVEEDLTPLRFKMLKELKRDSDNIKRVWALDGKINCVIQDGQHEVKKVISSPSDLVKVGWSVEKINDLGFYIPL